MNATPPLNRNHTDETPLPGEEDDAVSSEDSSVGLHLPAKQHAQYRQWFEKKNSNGATRTVLNFDGRFSPQLAILIFSLITVLAVVCGILAIRFLPKSKTNLFSPKTRLRILQAVPLNRSGFAPVFSIPLPLQTATCFCVDPTQRFYVGGDKKITLFSKEGKVLCETGPFEKQPTCLVFVPSDAMFGEKLLVGFQDEFRVLPLSVEGRPAAESVFSWKLPGKPALNKIIPWEKSFFLVDSGEKVVYEIDDHGKILQTIGKTSAPAKNPDKNTDMQPNIFPGFVVPSLCGMDMVVVPGGERLYITNPGKHRVEAFTRNGVWEPSLGWGTDATQPNGFCGSGNPSGLSLFSDGSFVTIEQFIPQIKVFSRTGDFTSIVAGSEEIMSPPVLSIPKPPEIPEPLKGATASSTQGKGEKTEPGKTDPIPFKPYVGDEQPIRIAVLPDNIVVLLDTTYSVLRGYAPKTPVR